MMFKTLDEITPDDAAIAGGKAFSCARLKQAGFPVPDGVVISAGAAEAGIRRVAQSPWVQSMPADALFAVRSSGIGEDSEGHSFAGIHETHLNVSRERLADAVLACVRSASSERARAYREVRHLEDQEARIGILVQQMVAASTSGVAFTINPITGADELVINAAWGLGEALVSGQVDPDEFRIRKRDAHVVSARLGVKGDQLSATPSLTPVQLDELASLLLRIEQYFGAPQDVEWCRDARQFWIVQSRPVTARRAPSPRDIEWTRANLAEVLPDQTSPQALSAYEDLLNRAERRFMGKLLAPESELGPITKSFHGRMYFNLSQFRRICLMAGAPPADLLRSFGFTGEIRPEDEITARRPLRELLRCLPDFARLGLNDARMGSLMRRHDLRIADALAKVSAADPRALSDAEIWAHAEWWWDGGPEYMQIIFTVGAVMFRESLVRKACNAVGFSYERLVYPQLAAGSRSVSTQQAVDLVALADIARHETGAAAYLRENDGTFADFRAALAGTRFLERFDHFLALYGHRGRYESDWALPRLRENPVPLLFAIRTHLEGPAQNLEAVVERQAAEAASAWRAFEGRLTWWQTLTVLPRVRSAIRRLKQQYVWREQVRSDLTRVMAHLRLWHLTLADRFVERGWIGARDDYFLLRLEEVGAAIEDVANGPGLRDIAARRAAEIAEQRDLKMPLLMRESELPMLVRQSHVTHGNAGDELTGLCVSPGSVEGEVVVMRDPGEFAKMRRGAILVAPATDPSWTPLFTLASGVIVEVGGMLSHASTIAREYGLPALANVKDATRVLRTGERIRLDASGGRVFRKSEE
jgi:phosphohistidine swiveling domain-containing protein